MSFLDPMLPKCRTWHQRMGAVAPTPKAALSAEDQAIGRAYRQGQRKNIIVVR